MVMKQITLIYIQIREKEKNLQIVPTSFYHFNMEHLFTRSQSKHIGITEKKLHTAL